MNQEYDLTKEIIRYSIEDFSYFHNNIFPRSFVNYEKFRKGRHLNVWCDMLQKSRNTCILAPRKHSKSNTIYSWLLWKNMRELDRNLEIIYLSYKKELAAYHLKRYKGMKERNEFFNEMRDITNAEGIAKYQWPTGEKHIIEPEGILSFKRGRHPDIIILDDVLADPTTMMDLGVIEKTNQRVFEEVVSMAKEGGEIKIIGCVNTETLILIPKGITRIGDLSDHKLLGYCNIKEKVYGIQGFNEATSFYSKGQGKGYILRVANGLSLHCSEEHPLLTLNSEGIQEWKMAKDIQEGEFLAIQFGQEIFGNKTIEADKAYLFGLWLAEGSYEKTGRITISNGDEEIHTFLLKQGFSRRDAAHSRKQSISLAKEMEKYGIIFCKSYEKTIPSGFFESCRENQKEFLKGMFDGDGSLIRAKGNKLHVSYYTTSKYLAEQLQIILLNFGIVSSLYNSPKRTRKKDKWNIHSKRESYEIRIKTHSHIFMQKIGFRIARKQAEIIKTKENVFPIPYQSKHLDRAVTKRSAGLCDIINYGKAISLQKLRKLLQGNHINKYCDEYKILQANSQFAWIKLKSKIAKEGFFVDIVVPETHSFFSNGFISHNTAQTPVDFFFKMKENPEFAWGEFPAVTDWKDKIVLWPEMFPWDRLMHIKNYEIGEKGFQKEYMIKPVWSADSFFIREQIEACINTKLQNVSRIESKNQVGAGWDIGKHAHPAHFTVFEFVPIGKGMETAAQRYEIWMDGWEYSKQLEFIKSLIEPLRIDYVNYDNTRGEMEGFYEKGYMDKSKFFPVNFTIKEKHSLAAEFEKRVRNKIITDQNQEVEYPLIEIMNHPRMINQILSVTNNLESVETHEGHGDSFWSISLALRKTASGKMTFLEDPDNILGLN